MGQLFFGENVMFFVEMPYHPYNINALAMHVFEVMIFAWEKYKNIKHEMTQAGNIASNQLLLLRLNEPMVLVPSFKGTRYTRHIYSHYYPRVLPNAVDCMCRSSSAQYWILTVLWVSFVCWTPNRQMLTFQLFKFRLSTAVDRAHVVNSESLASWNWNNCTCLPLRLLYLRTRMDLTFSSCFKDVKGFLSWFEDPPSPIDHQPRVPYFWGGIRLICTPLCQGGFNR